MACLHQEAAALAALPTDERLRALQRIIPRARVDAALAQTGRDRAHCRRLPGWFMVWFMIALGLCCRDAYRQVYRWLQVFRPGGIPGRSTLCEARRRLGVAPLRALAAQVVALLGRPETPCAFLAKLYPSAADRRRDRHGLLVRLIEYTLDDPQRPGKEERHRLLTTLLDAELDPARTLVFLYHERWEEEITLDELKTHQRERPVLRSQTPAGVVQEVYALMLAHY